MVVVPAIMPIGLCPVISEHNEGIEGYQLWITNCMLDFESHILLAAVLLCDMGKPRDPP